MARRIANCSNIGRPTCICRPAVADRSNTPRTAFTLIAPLTLAFLCFLVSEALAQEGGVAPGTGQQGSGVAPGGVPAVVDIPTGDEPSIATKNLLEVIRDGGLMMVPIVLCSFLLSAFVFERLIALRRGRVVPKPFVTRFLEQLRERQINREEALKACAENRSPVSDIFAAAVKKWGRPSVEIEQAIIDAGERVTNELRRYLRMFNGISTLSPLLGLLGTVTGMIRSFNTIAGGDAMGRPELLAGGIGEALITTAAGLCVAIPALIAHLFFVGKVDRLIVELDGLGQQVVEQLASDAWQRDVDLSSAKPKKTKAA